jgi:hypothetical protein
MKNPAERGRVICSAIHEISAAVPQHPAELPDSRLIVQAQVERLFGEPSLPDRMFFHPLDPARGYPGGGKEPFDPDVPEEVVLAVEHLDRPIHRCPKTRSGTVAFRFLNRIRAVKAGYERVRVAVLRFAPSWV